MRLLPESRAQSTLFLLFMIALAVSCIAPPYPQYLVLQHLPTVGALLALIVVERKVGISAASYAFVIAFLSLHVLGARYLYSYVPYDLWSERLLGKDVTCSLGFTRNHYDRAVHFFYGLLIAVPAFRCARRFLIANPILAGLFAVQFILATSTLYELVEWLAAITLAPDWAREYNGQQGDWWDPQKDMALALLGAALSTSTLMIGQAHAMPSVGTSTCSPHTTEHERSLHRLRPER